MLRLTPPHVFRYYQHMSEAAALDAAVNEAEEKLAANKDTLAALMMEPLMQGAAGMWAQPAGYVQALHDICRRHGILFILDEVATGFGRTGKMFACEHADVTPDLLCLAKGITGGYLPLAATLSTEEIFSAFLGEYKEYKTFFHGHTYTGNPLGCAVASANLALFERENIDRKDAAEDRVFAHAACARSSFHCLTSATCANGATWSASNWCKTKPARKIIAPEERIGYKVILEARKRGVMIRPLGDVIILMPPLSITDGELTALLDVVHDSIGVVTEN